MRVGDLVIRKIPEHPSASRGPAVRQRKELGHGVILSKQMGGMNPSHPCITVYYPKTMQTYDIAEGLMEIFCETR